jgi:hypothetical protein
MADQAVINKMNTAINAIQALQTAVTGLPAANQAAVQQASPDTENSNKFHFGPTSLLYSTIQSTLSQLNCNNKEHRKSQKEMT